MKVLQINSVSGIKSTGKICLETAKLLKKNGDECLIIFGRETASAEADEFSVKIGNIFTNVLHYIRYIITDDDGKGSYFPTKKAIKIIEKYNPDLIHLHNLHGHYINSHMLLEYIQKKKIPVIFSLYDCWMFTGGCTHFDYIGCSKWKTSCFKCPNQSKYPFDKVMVDGSKTNYRFKKDIMTSIERKIIAPGSFWLEGLVRQSFLGDSVILTVRSGIDLQKFKSIDTSIAKDYKIQKRIVLFVASQWTTHKGLGYINYLEKTLGEDYQLVIIGQLRDKKYAFDASTLHIQQTNSIDEMVSWYSAASVYVNLTLQETLGLTNVEALACGTPVVTFDSGGCKECVDESCGVVVPRGDIEGVIDGIRFIMNSDVISSESCRRKSEEFDKNDLYTKYLDLYKKVRDVTNGK